MSDVGAKIQLLLVLLPALIISATLHELAHGVVAYKLGDRTAKSAGRLTLNPIKHLDPLGSAMFVLTFLFFSFPFGWAKPVPVRPSAFRSPQRGMALVALAGPVTNFLIAWVIILVTLHTGVLSVDFVADHTYLTNAISLGIEINVVLGVFNLFPIPPLDGSRIIGGFMPKAMYEDWAKLDQFGGLILIGLLVFFQNGVMLVLQSGVTHVFQFLMTISGGG